MSTTMDMKTGDLEPALTLIVEDEGGVADLNGVVSWRILGKRGGTLVINDAPDAITVDPTNHSKATLTRAWQASETNVVGYMEFEAEAMWPGNRPQTFPAAGTVTVLFRPDLG